MKAVMTDLKSAISAKDLRMRNGPARNPCTNCLLHAGAVDSRTRKERAGLPGESSRYPEQRSALRLSGKLVACPGDCQEVRAGPCSNAGHRPPGGTLR